MKKYFLYLSYLVMSLLIGEFHPFSQFPMYNAFPNYSYVFYLKNEKAELIPYLRQFNFSKNAGFIAHIFYASFDHHHYPCGDNKEDPAHLKKVGEELIDFILSGEDKSKLNFDTLTLYRRYYFLDQDSIQFEDQMMYEKALQP